WPALDEQLVPDLAGRTGMERVFELRLQQRSPRGVERSCDALGATALAGRDDDADPAVGVGLRRRAKRCGRDCSRCSKTADKLPARHGNAVGHSRVPPLQRFLSWSWPGLLRPSTSFVYL